MVVPVVPEVVVPLVVPISVPLPVPVPLVVPVPMLVPEGAPVLVDEQEERAALAQNTRAITRTDQEAFCVIFIGRR